jgi:hypothetical protein
MADEFEKPGNSGFKEFLKALVIFVLILLGIVVVGFGLLVGFCSLGSKR